MINKKTDQSGSCRVQTGRRTCGDAPSGQMLLGIRQFNSRQWFECHETLEPLWLQEQGEMRNFYQGIIQVAIALNHWRNNNFNGAISLLEGGAKYLQQVPAVCQWVDVTGLVQQANRMRDALQRLGAEDMDKLDQNSIPQIHTVTV